MVCRIKTKSIQRRAAIVLRAAEILMLAVLSVLSFVEWGFRYYALVGVLVVSTSANTVQLLRRVEPKLEFLRARIIRKAAGMSVLLLIASLPAIVFPEYKPLPTTGKYQIKNETRHFTDESRVETYDKQGDARTLAVEFWYPEISQDSFPLVIFSHGAFGT